MGAVGVGAGIGAAALAGSEPGRSEKDVPEDGGARAGDAVAFRGEHQAGIVTPAQDRLHFAAFDVVTDDRDQLVELLQRWTAAAARMTEGRSAGSVGAMDGAPDAPPDDTGEAFGLPPSQLTITIGFGPTLFTLDGVDRFGIADRRPAALIDLPHFPADRLDPARTGGDICVQACAHDPQVAVHAVRNLARIGFGVRVGALVAARLRSHLVDVDGADHGAQPVRLQGRDRQPEGRAARADRRARLGRDG